MQIITSVEAQNNFGKLMNTIPREPVVITKHGRKYAMVLAYEDPIEFGEMDISDLSSEELKNHKESLSLDRSAFLDI